MLFASSESSNTTTAPITVLYNLINSVIGATSCGTATLQANGTASLKLTIPIGGPYYVFVRVTPPSSASRDVPCTTTLTTVLSPLWPSTNTAIQRWFNLGGNYALTESTHATWAGKAYDTTLMTEVSTWRITAPGYHSNMSNMQVGVGNGWKYDYGPRTPHILNHYSQNDAAIADLFSARNSSTGVFWWRWGFSASITVRRYRMGISPLWPNLLPSSGSFTITGYSSSNFTSGNVVATIPASSITRTFDVAPWVALSNTASFSYYEMRQTTGNFPDCYFNIILGS